MLQYKSELQIAMWNCQWELHTRHTRYNPCKWSFPWGNQLHRLRILELYKAWNRDHYKRLKQSEYFTAWSFIIETIWRDNDHDKGKLTTWPFSDKSNFHVCLSRGKLSHVCFLKWIDQSNQQLLQSCLFEEKYENQHTRSIEMNCMIFKGKWDIFKNMSYPMTSLVKGH